MTLIDHCGSGGLIESFKFIANFILTSQCRPNDLVEDTDGDERCDKHQQNVDGRQNELDEPVTVQLWTMTALQRLEQHSRLPLLIERRR